METVTDWTGRQVRYEYYNDGDSGGAAGDLKSVTSPVVEFSADFPIPAGHDYPNGKTWSYTYTTGFDDEGLLVHCTYTPIFCADDCDFGIQHIDISF